MKSRLLVIVLALLAVACTKPNEKAEINLNIGYEVNGKPLVTDSLCYENEAGNQFLITEIQWFLSNIELKNEEDNYTYHITVFDNGSSSIDVQARKRERISYNGDIIFEN